MTVVSAKNEGRAITETFAFNTQTLNAARPDTYLLRLKVNLKSLDGQSVGGRYLVDAVVLDSKGKKYPCSATGFPGRYIDLTSKGQYEAAMPMNLEAEVDYIFTVLNQVRIVDFIWKDFPPVRLEIKGAGALCSTADSGTTPTPPG